MDYPSLDDLSYLKPVTTLEPPADRVHAEPDARAASSTFAALKRLQAPPATAPSAPPASRVELKEVQPAVVQQNKSFTGAVDGILRQTCCMCSKPIAAASNVEVSIVLFGACKHVAHLWCALQESLIPNAMRSMSEPSFLLGGRSDLSKPGTRSKACLQCAKDDVCLPVPAAYAMRAHTDPQILLAGFKTSFRSRTEKNYDMLKEEPVKFAEFVKLLRLPGNLGERPVVAAFASSVLRRVRGTAEDEAQDAPLTKEQHLEKIKARAESGANGFFFCMKEYDRKLSNFLCNDPGGDLLTLYRCGVRSVDDLEQLGFDPIEHFRAEYKEKIPPWQLFDLYKFGFADLIRWDVCVMDMALKLPAISALEWALFGANVSKFLSIGMDAEIMRNFNFTLDEWVKHLGLELCHLSDLKLLSKDRCKTYMNWDPMHYFFASLP